MARRRRRCSSSACTSAGDVSKTTPRARPMPACSASRVRTGWGPPLFSLRSSRSSRGFAAIHDVGLGQRGGGQRWRHALESESGDVVEPGDGERASQLAPLGDLSQSPRRALDRPRRARPPSRPDPRNRTQVYGDSGDGDGPVRPRAGSRSPGRRGDGRRGTARSTDSPSRGG